MEGSIIWRLFFPKYEKVSTEVSSMIFTEHDLLVMDHYDYQKYEPHEQMMLAHQAYSVLENLGVDENKKYEYAKNIRSVFFAPCCICGPADQAQRVGAMIYEAWHTSFENMLRVSSSEYPLVLAAAISEYLPDRIYKQLITRLPEINRQLADIHRQMLLRNKNMNEGLCVNAEAPLISMLETRYDYTSHGCSIGGCWLKYKDEVPPVFREERYCNFLSVD